MNTVDCSHCGATIEIDKALEGQIEARVLAAERHKHQAALDSLKQAQADALAKERQTAAELAQRQLDHEKDYLRKQAEADLAHAKKQLEQNASNQQRQAMAEQETLVKSLRDDAEHSKRDNKALRDQLTELTRELRAERTAKENAEYAAQKKLAAEEAKIREEVQRTADERQRMNLLAKDKTITDLQKALDDAQRKAAQGSQQLQGEVLELDLEQALASAFRDDQLTPVAKGVRGGDIQQAVRSPRGSDCGLILWEVKRTKHWVDGWIPKLKEDMRTAKASFAVIVTEAMPKHIEEDLGEHQQIWICKPKLALVLGSLLRKRLLDVGAYKALAENRGDKADALYNFVTSHEFVHQVESMVETYNDMTSQVQKERVAYERLWAQREKQAQKLLLGTATIVGSMQGHIGQASMPRIKGLELLGGDEDEPAASSGGQASLL